MLTLAEVLSDFKQYAELNDDITVTISSRGPNGETPLHWMAILGDANGVRILYEAGADVNAIDRIRNTATHEAVANMQASALLALIECGADLKMKNLAGLSPIELAETIGFQHTIDILRAAQNGQ